VDPVTLDEKAVVRQNGEKTMIQDLWNKTGDRTKRCTGNAARTRRGLRGEDNLEMRNVDEEGVKK
jgi:hypothetical protein